MADLKAGSTVGGLPIWHSGTFPLVPVGNTLTYRGYKVYTENDKPQASNNDFVSKASGGQYLGVVAFKQGLQINATFTGGSDQNGLYSGDGDGATLSKANIDLVSWYGIGIRSSSGTNGRVLVINARNGDLNTQGNITVEKQISITTANPTDASHATRKSYVDGQINNVTTNANSRVLRDGDTMTGLLTAPQFASTGAASRPEHVPRLDQVITKGTIIDFGSY